MHLTTCTLTRRANHITRDSQAMHRTLKHDIPGRFLWSLPDPRTLVVQHEAAVHWPDVMPGVSPPGTPRQEAPSLTHSQEAPHVA